MIDRFCSNLFWGLCKTQLKAKIQLLGSLQNAVKSKDPVRADFWLYMLWSSSILIREAPSYIYPPYIISIIHPEVNEIVKYYFTSLNKLNVYMNLASLA